MYTDELIAELIACPKHIIESPKYKEGRANAIKRIFTMRSTDGINEFSCFINQNKSLPEDFSLGLVHITKTEIGKTVLFRCNGKHGAVYVEGESAPHHIGCHIHVSTAKRLNAGLRPEGYVEATDKFMTIEEGIQFFLKKIGVVITDRAKYFPLPNNQQEFGW